MANFRYVAINREGGRVEGVMTAVGEAELDRKLDEKGLVVLDSRPTDDSTATGAVRVKRRLFAAADRRELINFCVQLSASLSAGIPLIEAIEEIAKEVPGRRFKAVLEEIVRSVRGGEPFSAAVSQHPSTFSAIFVSLVRAGEEVGRIDQSLRHLVTYLEWREEIAGQIRRLTFYPVVLLVGLVALMLVLFGWALPRIFTNVRGDFELPMVTRLVQETSFFIARNVQWILAGILATIAGYIGVRATPRGRLWLDAFWIELPFYGEVLQKLVAARFVRIFRILITNGINILLGLELAGRSTDNAFFERQVKRARQKIMDEGVPLADGLSVVTVLPPLVHRMMRTGEKSGRLDETLASVHDYYEKEVPQTVEWFLRILELAVLFLLAGVVFVVILSIFMAILAIAQQATK